MTLDESDILIEKSISGGIPIWDRQVGRVLKGKLMTSEYSNLITMKLDRMFRLVSDMLATVDELNDANISFHIIDMNGEAVATSTPMGRFFLTMMGAMAEMERGLISERPQIGMNQLKDDLKKFPHSI